MNKPLVSIIIPVYNVKPCFIQETLQSALVSTYENKEIIVVNDGSKNEDTLSFLRTISNPLIKVINKENDGLAMARNTGIENANGTYILPLDADDLIEPDYIEKAVNVIENDCKIGIVYSKADLFGTQSGLWEIPDFKMVNMLRFNCIFCTALFRKSDWLKVGGYKKEMKYGWEDYEFWLSLIENGAQVHKIDKVLFHYRKHEVSMLSKVEDNEEKQKYLTEQIHRFHEPLFKKYEKQLKKVNRKDEEKSLLSSLFKKVKNYLIK